MSDLEVLEQALVTAVQGVLETMNVLEARLAEIKTAVASAEARLAQVRQCGPIATDIDAHAIRKVLRARQRRIELLAPDLFADPAWDMLLEAFACELEQRRVSVSALCAIAGVPYTTALRWMKKLEDDGWLRREKDPFDGRRIWVELTVKAEEKLQDYFDRVGPVLCLL